MGFIPNTPEDIAEMLKCIGVNNEKDLFSGIPLTLEEKLNLPSPLSELELLKYAGFLAERNNNLQRFSSFIGGGSYHHYIPSVVPAILSRSEFYTSYTPYQPEVSQGTLQAIFEFQTFICMLMGMDVSNASMYDGASATAEGVLMASRHTSRNRVIISRAVHPNYRKVAETYISGRDESIEEIGYDDESGMTSLDELKKVIDEKTACVVIQSPNFFGVIENLESFAEVAHEYGALFLVTFSEALAYGLLKPPGVFGTDIVAGEGQSLGIPQGFGGPNLGILACKLNYLRNLPGRLVGETNDKDGKRAYVLTLTAREQHIRRAKAPSNICSNEGLCALAATIYLSALGKQGFFEISRQNHIKAEYTKDLLSSIPEIRIRFKGQTFNEFVIEINDDPEKLLKKLVSKGVLAGIEVGKFYNELSNCILLTVTEMNTIDDIEKLIEGIRNYM